MSFARDEGRTLPPSVDAFINMRDLVVGDNDWYNVTPSVRRAIEGFALILRDHEARLMNGGDSGSPMPTARSPASPRRSPSDELGSSTLEVAQLKDGIARLEEELAVAKRQVAEVTDVAVRAASDAKTAVVEVDAIRPDVDRLANGLSSLHTAVGAHLKDIRGTLANGTPGNSTVPERRPGRVGPVPEGGEMATSTRRVRDLEGGVERIVVGSDGQSAGVARRVAALEDNHKTLERRTRRVERVVEDVRSAEDRRAREEAERMRELRLGGHAGGGPGGGGGPRRRRGSSSSSSSSEDGRARHSSGRGDDPIAPALAGASVSKSACRGGPDEGAGGVLFQLSTDRSIAPGARSPSPRRSPAPRLTPAAACA